MYKFINYRPEVDGLRGIAVLLVIIYHARFLTSDGFLLEGAIFSVDMFYVISGYLMTTIILNQIQRDGYLSYKIFIESRIRRIWPTYFFVLCLCILFFTVGMYETSLGVKQFMQNAFAAAAFQSNHFFPFRIIEYAAENSLVMPLLHTWTLSVEVQFYTLFPFLILLIINFLKKKFLTVFFILAVLSLILAEIITSISPAWSFYLFPTRIFELMTGGMAAIIERNKNYIGSFKLIENNKKNSEIIKNFGSFLGAFLLIFTFVVYDEQTRHPSIYTIVPVFGTGLLILFSRDNLMQKILSNKLIVWVGLISYSLYLFHYPIFSYLRGLQILDENNNIIKIALIFLSIFVAIISFFLIEKPFRNRKLISKKLIYSFTFISGLFLLSLTYYLHENFKFETKTPKFIVENRNVVSWKDARDGLGYCYGRSDKYCTWHYVGNPAPKTYLVGDSHMSTLERGILEFIDKETIGTKFMTGRFYLPDFNKYNLATQKKEYYSEAINRVKELITKEYAGVPSEGNIIILGAYYSNHLKEDEYIQVGPPKKNNTVFSPISENSLVIKRENREKLILDGIKKSIEDILEKNKLILIYPIPEAGILVARQLYLKYKFLSIFTGQNFQEFIKENKYYITSPYKVYKDRNKEIIEMFDNLNHPNLFKVYPAKHFCDNQIKNKCITHTDKEIYYHDRHHLSPNGAKIVNKDIIEILKKIYKK